MRTISITTISLLLATGMSAPAQTNEPVPPRSSESRRATEEKVYVLRVTCEPGLLPTGSYDALDYLLSTGIIEDACAKTVPDAKLEGWQLRGTRGLRYNAAGEAVPEEPCREVFMDRAGLDLGPGQPNVIVAGLRIWFKTPLQAEEWSSLIEPIRDGLQNMLGRMQDTQTERLLESAKQAEKRVEETKMRLAELQKRRAEMMSSAGYSDLSQAFMLELAGNIEKERQENALKVERLKFRQEAIQRTMAQLAAQVKDPANLENPVVQAYKQKLDILQQKLEMRKQQAKSGIIPNAEVSQAEAELAMAKAELQDRMQAIMNEAGGKRLAALNEELSTISLDLAEAQARAAALDKRSDQMKKDVSRSDQYEMQIGILLPPAKAAFESAVRRYQYLRDRLDSQQPPTVQVYGR